MRCADKDGAKKAQPHGPGNHQQSDRCCLNMPGPASYVAAEWCWIKMCGKCGSEVKHLGLGGHVD
jgi:hypothetical protein